MAEISEKEYEGLKKMHGEEAVKHLKPEVSENKPNEETPKEDKKEELPIKAETPTEIKAEAKEISDADFLEYFKKKTGKELKSFEEIIPQATAEEIAEKREASKLAYAIQNNLISKKQYDAAIADSSNSANLVFEDFKSDALAEDSTLSDEQIQEEYAEEFGLNADPNSAKYKRGQKKLTLMADKILKEKHASFFQIDGKYSQHEAAESIAAERNNKIISEAPKYKQVVESAFAKKSKVGVQINGAPFEIQIDESDFADIKEGFLSKSISEENILKGYTPENLEEVIGMAIINKNIKKILESHSNKYFEEHAKGTRGILPQTELRKAPDGKPVLSEKEIAYYTKVGLLKPQTTN